VTRPYETWWASLRHGGLLIAPSRLDETFPDDIPPLSLHLQDRLRRELNAFRDDPQGRLVDLLDTVLEEILDLAPELWMKASAVPASWGKRLVTGDNEKPRRLWLGPHGAVLPVFTSQEPRLGVGRGRRAAARIVEWLRRSNQKLALLTNGRQWRLIHAGPDYEAWCEWDADLWFEQGQPGPQLLALRLLLTEVSLSPTKAGALSPLMRAIAETRRGESELTQDMGERVREAVEKLIFASSGVLERMVGTGEHQVTARDIYTASVRLIMRCVVVLFAEARGLLPRDRKTYEESYGIQSLREQLDRTAGGNARARLGNSQSAWPRLVTLFRLVYGGCTVAELPVQAYGGTLFEPGDPESPDPVLRAIAAFEDPRNAPYDIIIHDILDRLTRAVITVRQGAASRRVAVPVDFYGLGTEYIGILYEGLLDYELRRRDDDATVVLNLGDCPTLPLEALRQLSADRLSGFFERFQSTAAKADDAEEEAEQPEEAEAEPDQETEEQPEEAPALVPIVAEELSDEDEKRAWREKVDAWARDAVAQAKLVKPPRSKAQSAQEQYRNEVAGYAARLIGRVIMPGEWYLVRYGNTRKGTGTFYTRPQPAGPIARRALQPLAYQGTEHDASGRVTEWHVREPQEILALKVCDPAMGSGSFLIASLRYLTDALHESLHTHGRIQTHGVNGAVCRLADGMPSGSIQDELLPVPPDHPDFDIRLKARLRRHIVERCIYGVDIDALAVELGRISLWIETMDRELPFGFLDHKLKPGNSLVGCWFDRFLDYPAAAWLREGGDKDNARFVHHSREVEGKKGQRSAKGDPWTTALSQQRKSIAGLLAETIRAGEDALLFSGEIHVAQDVHDQALGIFEELHRLPVEQAEQRRARYRELQNDPEYQRLRDAFDLWCALWFWPADKLASAPMPGGLLHPSEGARDITRELRSRLRFFHWELEFPDVFTGERPGFHAVIGNPPWEIQKPISKEFFSNFDPLYRGYGKQEALDRQMVYFQASAEVERSWMAYRAHFKALSNWTKHAGAPFGDRITVDNKGKQEHVFPLASRFADSQKLHDAWKRRRGARRGYAAGDHPFLHQGSADINTYKMFLEAAWSLARSDGQVGMLVPSGIYSDKGASDLRAVFREQGRWTHLYVFQNERFIFPAVHHSFKVAMVAVTKGSTTERLLARFRLGPGDSPEIEELEDDVPDESRYLPVEAAQLRRFSPNSGAVLEVCYTRDLEILEKLYRNGVLLGDRGPKGWGIEYVREFDMTNDSKLFPPRQKWEDQGYRPDEYGHWLKGAWMPYNGPRNILGRQDGWVLSADASAALHVDEIENVGLPLYEGRMTGSFDFSEKGWVEGKGRRAVWREIPFDGKVIEPQYIMEAGTARNFGVGLHPKVVFMDVTSATNARTFRGSVDRWMPCGHSAPTLRTSTTLEAIALAASLNSFCCDSLLRLKVSGVHLTLNLLEETSVFRNVGGLGATCQMSPAAALCFPHHRFAREWLSLPANLTNRTRPWKAQWAVSQHERLRLRAMIDAIVSELFGLTVEDFKWIMRGCDHSASWMASKSNTRSIDTKGFWRSESATHPELRHSVLAQVAFQELRRVGIEAFLSMNNGNGWMLPETLRLSDYGLGHDERAREPQPVASILGPRLLPWQCEHTVEESWHECELHADLIGKILDASPSKSPTSESDSAKDPEDTKNPQIRLF
jgi:hypothetical protein